MLTLYRLWMFLILVLIVNFVADVLLLVSGGESALNTSRLGRVMPPPLSQQRIAPARTWLTLALVLLQRAMEGLTSGQVSGFACAALRASSSRRQR